MDRSRVWMPPQCRRPRVRVSGGLGILVLVLLSGATPRHGANKPGEPASVRKGTAMVREASNDEAIRPFRVNVPEADIIDLRRRITATRWPDKEVVTDQSQGVPLATMQKLARYWGTDYDWRKCEAKLNALPQFVTQIDGVD